MISEKRRLLATTALELDTSLAADVGLGAGTGGTGGLSEVGGGLARVDGTLQEDGVSSGGADLGELIEGVDLTASSEDAGASLLGEAEGSNLELGDIEKTVVIDDGGDSDGDGVLVLSLGVFGNSGQRHGGSVDLALEETLKDDLVEGSSSPAGEERVELCLFVLWSVSFQSEG